MPRAEHKYDVGRLATEAAHAHWTVKRLRRIAGRAEENPDEVRRQMNEAILGLVDPNLTEKGIAVLAGKIARRAKALDAAEALPKAKRKATKASEKLRVAAAGEAT